MKYRIYPTKDQEAILNQWLGCGRFVYNHFLSLNMSQYNEDNKFIFYYDMASKLKDLKKKTDTKFLKNAPSQSMQQKCRDLEAAIKRCYKNKFGFPHFKSRKTDTSGLSFSQSWSITGNRLNLPKFKTSIRVKMHRPLEGQQKTLHIKRNRCGQWFISIVCHFDEPVPVIIKSSVGIDLGLKEFAVTSDGEVFKNPRFLKKKLHNLKKAQRNLSRKKKGSNNREKSRRNVAKVYLKVSNQRKDFVNQTASAITKQYDLICIEDLAVKNMVKNRSLSKAISDVGWGMFSAALDWQCKKKGKGLVKIDRFFPSSKNCSSCGSKKNDLTLQDRIYDCESCGLSIDRDLNAAFNIQIEGLRVFENTAGTAEINACGDMLNVGSTAQEASVSLEA